MEFGQGSHRERELAEIITLIQSKVVPLMDKYETNLEEILRRSSRLDGFAAGESNGILCA